MHSLHKGRLRCYFWGPCFILSTPLLMEQQCQCSNVRFYSVREFFFGYLHETDYRTKTARKRGEIEQLVLFACELLLMSSRAEALLSVCRQIESQRSASSLGSTGRMRFPNEESWVMKKPDEWPWACCRAAFCWAAMCCCSALSLTSFRLGLDDRGMLAPGLFMAWPCISRRFSLSSSARMATRVLFWKPGPGGLAAISS